MTIKLIPGKLYRARHYLSGPFAIPAKETFMCIDFKPDVNKTYERIFWGDRTMSSLTVLYKLKTITASVFDDQIDTYVEEIH